MRWMVVFLVGIFLVSLGSAVTSTTQTNYSLFGCTFDVDGESIGVKYGDCSGGAYAGEFFCSLAGQGIRTADEGLGCAMGNTSYRTDSGGEFCCPATDLCNDTLVKAGTGGFKCDTRTVNCEDQEDKGDCEHEDVGCRWIAFTGECVSNLWDKSCNYYDQGSSSDAFKENACIDDEYDIGKKGVGTELCGTTINCNGDAFSVTEDDCGCGWYPDLSLGQRCRIDMVAKEMFDTSPTRDAFSCSNSYDFEGDCIDGKQIVTWSSDSNVESGFGGALIVPDDCLAALGCEGGSKPIFCGEDLIKLPGFSLFALFASLFIVGIYYIKKS